jgi:hypothetical protein
LSNSISRSCRRSSHQGASDVTNTSAPKS